MSALREGSFRLKPIDEIDNRTVQLTETVRHSGRHDDDIPWSDPAAFAKRLSSVLARGLTV